MRTSLGIAGLIAATALAGCGKTGGLERPGPLFGAGRNTTTDAQEAQRTQEPARPVNTVDPRERTSDPAPPRTLPIDGASNNDPSRAPPQGVIPDPYNNPRR